MRISNGKQFHNAFVQYAYLGDNPVGEIWLGDRKLYPSDESRISRLYVELPDEGSDEWCYLQHGLDALKLTSKEVGYMLLRVAGMEYAVEFSHSGLHKAGLDHNELSFSQDEGPSLHDVQTGDEIELSIFVGVRQSTIVYADPDKIAELLPILPQTKLCGRVVKGQKKTNAISDFWLFNQQEELYKGQIAIRGHKRGSWSQHLSTLNELHAYPLLRVQCEAAHYPHASSGSGWLLYPAISKTIKAKITKIIGQ